MVSCSRGGSVWYKEFFLLYIVTIGLHIARLTDTHTHRQTQRHKDKHSDTDTPTQSERIIKTKTLRDRATHLQSQRHTPTHRQKYRHMNHNERPADVIFVLTRDGRGWHDWWAWSARITKIEVFLTKRLCLGQWGVVFRPCFSVPRSWRRGHWTEFGCVHGTQKRVRSYLQPFSDTSQKFPKYPEQYFYKIPLLLSELSSCLFTQLFRTFSRMFWYSPLVGLMRKSIMIRKPSTPFEKIQPFSQTFEYHGRDWLKS